eukprot:EW705757.1.p2 GENE.EW705757.1~~EW705757.1.p2  ORF type:complete len:178 (+),score=78.29 EW705757.1:64-534(+)
MIDSLVDDIEEQVKKCEGKDTKDNKCADALKEAEDLLKQLKVDVNTITDKTKKAAYQQKIKNFETRLLASKKSALLEPERARAPQTKTEKEDEGLEILKKSHAQLIETEQVGVGILQNLDSQKATIQRSHANLQTVHGKLKQSDGLLTQMSKWWRG